MKQKNKQIQCTSIYFNFQISYERCTIGSIRTRLHNHQNRHFNSPVLYCNVHTAIYSYEYISAIQKRFVLPLFNPYPSCLCQVSKSANQAFLITKINNKLHSVILLTIYPQGLIMPSQEGTEKWRLGKGGQCSIGQSPMGRLCLSFYVTCS